MKKIVVINSKGGCGKSTLVVALADMLEGQIIDLDHQKTLREKILTYCHFISDLMYILREDCEKLRSSCTQIVTQVDNNDHINIGELIALEHFFSIAAKLALEHDIPPYIWDHCPEEETLMDCHFPGK